MTIYLAINKAEYFIYGCDKLFIRTDHKPLVAFFRKEDPKPLDQIVNKRLRKYVSEITELRFTIFNIPGVKNLLSYRGSRFPSSRSGDDRGDSTVKSIFVRSDTCRLRYMQAQLNASSAMQAQIHADLPVECPQFAQIFAYGASGPAFDADYLNDDIVSSKCTFTSQGGI